MDNAAFPVTVDAVRGLIDHAILKPELTRADVDAQLDEAAAHRVFSVCVRPSDVAHAVERLTGTGVGVGTVIGFPHGTTSTAAKVAESLQALADGAFELDMVQNIGAAKSGDWQRVEQDVRAVVDAAGDTVVKVILETAFLTDDEIVAASRAAQTAGAAFVKTSTGFAGGGATAEHIALMRRTVGADTGVKASGGVRENRHPARDGRGGREPHRHERFGPHPRRGRAPRRDGRRVGARRRHDVLLNRPG